MHLQASGKMNSLNRLISFFFKPRKIGKLDNIAAKKMTKPLRFFNDFILRCMHITKLKRADAEAKLRPNRGTSDFNYLTIFVRLRFDTSSRQTFMAHPLIKLE